MKKTILVSIMAAILILCSCKKDPVSPHVDIEKPATIIKGSLQKSPSDKIDSVYAQITTETNTITLAKSEFDGKNFSLALPSTIEDRFLSSIKASDLIDVSLDVSISDEDALLSDPIIFKAIGNGNELGEFYYGNLASFLALDPSSFTLPTKGDAIIVYIYANKNVTIKSASPQIIDDEGIMLTMNIDATLVAGWNTVAISLINYDINLSTGYLTLSTEMTTKATSNQNWFYGPEDVSSLDYLSKSLSQSIRYAK